MGDVAESETGSHSCGINKAATGQVGQWLSGQRLGERSTEKSQTINGLTFYLERLPQSNASKYLSFLRLLSNVPVAASATPRPFFTISIYNMKAFILRLPICELEKKKRFKIYLFAHLF